MQRKLVASISQLQLQRAMTEGTAAAPSAPMQLARMMALQGAAQPHLGVQRRHLSTEGRHGYSTQQAQDEVQKHLLVNTLQLAHQFEAVGLGRKAAEELAMHITELIIMNKAKMDETFVHRAFHEKAVMEQDSRVANFKAELSKAQDMAQTNVNKDLERQQSFLDKMKTEVRHEIDKLTASQRLDMNLERGRMRDDLQLIRDKSSELEIKVDRDINALKSSVEQAKNDTIKSLIAVLGVFCTIAFTISRLVSMQ